jgi:hypothetical protein
MPDLFKDYHARDGDAHLTSSGQEAVLMFLCPEGWIGVTLGRADLERLQARISRELSRATLPTLRR